MGHPPVFIALLVDEVALLVVADYCFLPFALFVLVVLMAALTARPIVFGAIQIEIEPGRICSAQWIVRNIAVLVQRLRVFEMSPHRIWAEEPPHRTRIVAGFEVVIP